MGREELHAFLNQTRVLINLLPNTAQTVGIINSELLDQLPDGAYVLNLARGVHVQEADLLAALDSGKLKGAMLDVFSRTVTAGKSIMAPSASRHDAAHCGSHPSGGSHRLY